MKIIVLLDRSAGERSEGAGREGAGREGPGGYPRGLSEGAGLEKSPNWSLSLRAAPATAAAAAVLPGT